MRIGVLSNLFPPDQLGGYELLAADVVEALRDRGHHVDVLTSSGGVPKSPGSTSRTEAAPEDRRPGGQRGTVVRSLRLARPFGAPLSSGRLRYLRAAAHNRGATARFLRDRGRPDAVLVFSLRRLGLTSLRSLQRAGVPFVLTVNDDWPCAYVAPGGATRRWVEERVFPCRSWHGLRMDRVAYVSAAVRREVFERGAPLPWGSVLPQGVNHDQFWSRPFLPLPAAPRLLFVGRLHPSKAPEVALDALAALRAASVQATLTIAGTPFSPEYGTVLRERARELGIESSVEWLGWVARADLPGVYRQADLFLFMSRLAHEGQGLTYLEAMASGVPVIASPSGGALEFLDRHPVTVRPAACTGEAFAQAILELSHDVARQRELVRRARFVIETDASLARYIEALESQLVAAARLTGAPSDGDRAACVSVGLDQGA